MQPIGEFRRQKLIDETVPLDPATTIKPGGHDSDAIMRAPAFACPRMPRVMIGLVDDIDENGTEPRRQTRDNSLLHDHGLSTPVKQIATLNILRWAHGPNIPIGTRFAGFCWRRAFRACPMASAVIKVMAWI
jgi:hypothetical protein